MAKLFYFYSYQVMMFTGGLDCTQKTSTKNFGKNTYASAALFTGSVQSDGLK